METILDVKNLDVSFQTDYGVTHAVRDVSFQLHKNETLGIVGESGSGKSVSCYSLIRLLQSPPAKINKGQILFDGIDLLQCSEKHLQGIRGKRISMIFQDPMTSLNPYLTIGDQIAEPLIIHDKLSKKEAKIRALEQLEKVGIKNPQLRYDQYPHEFSGGMRQRVMIAMALITRPEILIADEPTTALDVSIQKQVLELINELKQDLGTSVILITHDLGVVKHYADRINVMYAGRIIESAPTLELLNNPAHAYTKALMRSIPCAQAKGEKLYTIPGLPPNLNNPVVGCSFKPRNTLGNPALCSVDEEPALVEISPDHWVQNCPGCLA